jgi:hypothetical protein
VPQPQPRERSGRNRTTARLLHAAALAGTLALLPLITACGSGDADAAAGGKPSKTSAAAAMVAPAKVEVIAQLTGCKAKIRVEADQLREGVCHTKKGDYLITTFPEEKYKRTWLDSASVYGGKYLVGTRWVVSAKPKLLEPLRAKLGGTVQELRGTGPKPSSS